MKFFLILFVCIFVFDVEAKPDIESRGSIESHVFDLGFERAPIFSAAQAGSCDKDETYIFDQTGEIWGLSNGALISNELSVRKFIDIYVPPQGCGVYFLAVIQARKSDAMKAAPMFTLKFGGVNQIVLYKIENGNVEVVKAFDATPFRAIKGNIIFEKNDEAYFFLRSSNRLEKYTLADGRVRYDAEFHDDTKVLKQLDFESGEIEPLCISDDKCPEGLNVVYEKVIPEIYLRNFNLSKRLEAAIDLGRDYIFIFRRGDGLYADLLVWSETNLEYETRDSVLLPTYELSDMRMENGKIKITSLRIGHRNTHQALITVDKNKRLKVEAIPNRSVLMSYLVSPSGNAVLYQNRDSLLFESVEQ